MLTEGPAKKVTIFLNEDAKRRAGSLHEAVMQFLMRKQVAGATAIHAFEGFGAHHVMHTPRIEALTEHLPVRIEFIESAATVDALMPELCEMVADGLIEVQDTMVVKVGRPR